MPITIDMEECISRLKRGWRRAGSASVEGLLGQFFHPYIYLDQEVMADRRSWTVLSVARAAAALVQQCEGVSAAITSADTRYSPARNRGGGEPGME